MRKILISILVLGILVVPASLSVAKTAHPNYALGKARVCKVHYIKKTLTREVTKRVKIHGKWKNIVVIHRVKIHGKWKLEPVIQRYVGCIYRAPITATTVTTVPVLAASAAPPTTSAPALAP